jgi:hypothetical protein
VFIENVVAESMGYLLRLTPDEMKGIEKKHVFDVTQTLRLMLIRMHGRGSRQPFVQTELFQLNLAFAWMQVRILSSSRLL